jgi:hypothetical protein
MTIETEHNIGDTFFCINDNCIFQTEVCGFIIENFVNRGVRITKVTYTLKDIHGFGLQFNLREGDIRFYRTKEALINSLSYKTVSNGKKD